MNRILVIAPHGDDGTIACGGTIAKFAVQGKDIHYATLYTEHTEELQRATDEIGVKQLYTLHGFSVRNFNRDRQNILEELLKLKKSIDPDLVMAPCPKDFHQDHFTVALEVLRSCKDRSILGYEMPWNNLSIDTECFVSLDKSDMERKVSAVGKHVSQLSKTYTQPDFLWSWAKTRGMQIGKPYAEVFEVVRWIL